MAASQKFCLKWNNFQNSVTSVFDNLRQDEELVDITLCCEGKKIKAHRMMLSACSPYFRDLLKDNPCQHPLFFMKDTSFVDMAAVIEFVYKGEVNVLQSQLGSFLKTAEMLQVKGLSGDEDDDQFARSHPMPASKERPPERSRLAAPPPSSPASRQRMREPPDAPSSPRHKRRRMSDSGGSRPGSPAAVQPVAATPPSQPMVPPPLDAPLDGPAAAPAVPLPPPPPPAVLSAEPTALLTPQHDLATPQHELQSAVRQDFIKVEKIDIADDDNESLEATLGQVSTFEASQFDGSDHSASSHDVAGLLSGMAEHGGADMMAAGTSEDGASQGLLCPEPGCGKRLRNQPRLSEHRAWHRGETVCHVCGRRFSYMKDLRSHALRVHNLVLPRRARSSYLATSWQRTGS